MPPKAQIQPIPKPPILPALFLLAGPLAWPIFEWYSIQGFAHGYDTYDYAIESLSDLGIDYRQVHPLKHYNVQSHRYATINFDFLQAGACFGIAQLLLLWLTRQRVTSQTALIRTLRFVLTLLYVGGMVLFAQIHGGPREKMWKIIGWHWNGLAMAAIAGSLNSILAAAVPGQFHEFERSALYRALSVGLGSAGLYSFYRWAFTLGEWDYQTKLGLWERGCIYPVLIWEAVTGFALLVARFGGSGVAKGKKA